MKAPHLRLLDALVLPLPQAAEAWRGWRTSADLDRLDPASFLMLPSLAGRMQDWIAGDPQADLLRGICRRAWSQNQIHLKTLASVIEILHSAGIERIAAVGPVLWARFWPEQAIRPIGAVDVLIEPACVGAALDALSRQGWSASDGVQGKLHFAPALTLGAGLRLNWRALPHTDLALRRPAPVPFEQRTIPLEHSLVAALGAHHPDGVDWHGDALMLCAQPRLDWQKVEDLLRHRTEARQRMEELRRDWGVSAPASVTRNSWSSPAERSLAALLRAYRRRRKLPSSLDR